MPTQTFSDQIRFKGSLLNLGSASDGAEKWARSSRIVFCMAGAIASWMIFVRLAEILLGH
jgi:hypothetical protein